MARRLRSVIPARLAGYDRPTVFQEFTALAVATKGVLLTGEKRSFLAMAVLT